MNCLEIFNEKRSVTLRAISSELHCPQWQVEGQETQCPHWSREFSSLEMSEEEDRNKLLSGFEGEKKKWNFDLVDKKWIEVASGLCEGCLQQQNENTLWWTRRWDTPSQDTGRAGCALWRQEPHKAWIKEKQYPSLLSGAQDERKGRVRLVLHYLQLKHIRNLIFFWADLHLLRDCPGFCKVVTWGNKKQICHRAISKLSL